MGRIRKNSARLLKAHLQRSGDGQERQRTLVKRMRNARAVPIVAKAAFRLFHGLSDGVEIVTGRDYREEQNQGAS